MTVKNFTATKAFLKRDGKILLLRESSKYADGVMKEKYGVPGGRLDPDEAIMDGLKREVFEETGLRIENAEEFYESEIAFSKNDEEWHIRRMFFICEAPANDIILSDDHEEFIWIDPKEYQSVSLPRDLHEVFEAYLLKN